MSDAEVEAGDLEVALNWTLAQLQGNVAAFRSTHTDAETVVGIKEDFIALAFFRSFSDPGAAVTGDYICWGLALLRLLDARKKIMELEDAVAFRDSLIRDFSAIREL